MNKEVETMINQEQNDFIFNEEKIKLSLYMK